MVACDYLLVIMVIMGDHIIMEVRLVARGASPWSGKRENLLPLLPLNMRGLIGRNWQNSADWSRSDGRNLPFNDVGSFMLPLSTSTSISPFGLDGKAYYQFLCGVNHQRLLCAQPVR